jgi:hypothetical protein
VKGFILAKDYNYKQGRVWKANTGVVLFSNGLPRKIIIAENWRVPSGIVINAGTKVVLHSNGGPQRITFFTFSCRKEHGIRR